MVFSLGGTTLAGGAPGRPVAEGPGPAYGLPPTAPAAVKSPIGPPCNGTSNELKDKNQNKNKVAVVELVSHFLIKCTYCEKQILCESNSFLEEEKIKRNFKMIQGAIEGHSTHPRIPALEL